MVKGEGVDGMNFLYVFAALMIGAYLFQALFGLKQIKHFNQTYQLLRKKGKVAIGRRSGKINAGTLVMFAIDSEGRVLAAKKMQGVTVFAKFHDLAHYVNQDIHYLDRYHPLVRKENKLIQEAIENAREIYLRVEIGNYHEEKPISPLMGASIQIQLWKNKILKSN